MWENFTSKRMYITGGAGSRYQGESFGADYELPNRTAYAETCGAIASFMWNWRLLQVTGKARYADEMERALYNGVLPGVSLDGRSYFYTNPLAHDGGEDLAGSFLGSNRRTTRHWDHVPCCPPNVARTLASLGGYLYGKRADALYVHHYAAGTAEIPLDDATVVRLTQKTDYPWDGDVELAVQPEGKKEFVLCLRIPGWVRSPRVETSFGEVPERPVPGSYLRISRAWQAGDTVSLHFPMPVVRHVSHPRVSGNDGCIALTRGPIVYCIESVDHPGIDMFEILLPHGARFSTAHRGDPLGGMTILTAPALVRSASSSLYPPLEGPLSTRDVGLTAVPYFSWANREPGAMRVWIPSV
jgi:hypothetical protein